jgi:tocopherol O-methyltransferase
MILPSEIQTAAAVASHYDELDPFYREIWGKHVHHGYWKSGRETPEQAVEALVDLLAERLDLERGQHIGDIGCGYGATALRLAERYGVTVTGFTISSVQAAHAQASVGHMPRVRILCEDWLVNSVPDSAFARVFSIESSEHMVDKGLFFREAFRTLQPGGRLGVCAWLARDGARAWEIKHLLEPICREGRLPGMGSESDYRAMATAAGFLIADVEDLSRRVRRTWAICARRVAAKLATSSEYRRFVLNRNAKNRDFALSLVRLLAAYRTGSMRYCLMTAVKPV